MILGEPSRADIGDIAIRDWKSMRLHGQAMRTFAEPFAEDENQSSLPHKDNRRPSSVIQEIRRQTGVFFDDSEVDGEATGGSEDETAIVLENEHEKTT